MESPRVRELGKSGIGDEQATVVAVREASSGETNRGAASAIAIRGKL